MFASSSQGDKYQKIYLKYINNSFNILNHLYGKKQKQATSLQDYYFCCEVLIWICSSSDMSPSTSQLKTQSINSLWPTAPHPKIIKKQTCQALRSSNTPGQHATLHLFWAHFPPKHPLFGENQLLFFFKSIYLFLIRRSSNSPDNGQFDAVNALQRKYYISASQDVRWDTKWTRLFVTLPIYIFILLRQSLGHLLFNIFWGAQSRCKQTDITVEAAMIYLNLSAC